MAKTPKFKAESNEEWQTRHTNFKEALDELSEQADTQREDKENIDILRQLERELEDGSAKKGSMAEALLKKEIERLKNTNLKDNKSDSVSGEGESRETKSNESVSSKDDEDSKYWEIRDPASEKYLCGTCGNAMGNSKFCSNCGTERPKTKETKSIRESDEGDFKINPRQFRFKSWEGYDIEQLRYALNFAEKLENGKIFEDLGILGKDVLNEDGKKFSNQQEALDDILKKMYARLKELEAGNKRKKDPEPMPKEPKAPTPEVIVNSTDETLPIGIERPEVPVEPQPNPEVPQEEVRDDKTVPVPHLEVPGAEPLPEIAPPEAHDETPPSPEQMEPEPEIKQTIEIKDAQKLRAMYEVADRAEQKKPRWGWLKERMKGVIGGLGWWESHVAESFRTGTKRTAKETEQEMKQIRSITEGTSRKDLLEVKRQRIAELRQRLAYSEIQLAKYIAEAENPAISKHAQPENVIRELGNEVNNIRREIEKRENELAELEEQRKAQNQEIISGLTVHGVEGFENYILTLSEMPEGPTRQLAMENLTGIVRILDGVEERLKSELNKKRTGLLKRIFGEEDKTYRGAELLSQEKLARVKRDIFERCIVMQQGQVKKGAESVKTIIRKNLDPEWWKRYVATAVEAALAGIAAKFILGNLNTNLGPLSVESFPPTPVVPGAEQIGMHKTVWATTKQYMIDKLGIINPTDAQVMEASKVVLGDTNLHEVAWSNVHNGLSSRVLPEGFPLIFEKAKILASIVK